MKFPNALKGVSKIYTAEILALIAAFVIVLAIIFGACGIGFADVGEETVGGILALGALVFVLAFTVLTVISYVINIVGFSAASKDEPAFKRALIAIVVGIVAIILAAVFSNKDTTAAKIISSLASAVSTACELLITFYCIDGIKNLAVKLDKGAVKAKADKAVTLIYASYIISIICKLVHDFSQTDASDIVSGIFGLVAIVFSIIAYCVYMSLLRNAKKMLAE